MFKYVTDVNEIAHFIIDNYAYNKNFAIDATLGNGYDCEFLCDRFKKVYAFDIQENVIDKFNQRNYDNVELFLDSHENMDKYIKGDIDCVMFNLGFLPGGDKKITTKADSSLIALKKSIDMLNRGGIISLAIYRGHFEGKKEEKNILHFLKSLPKSTFGVLQHSFFNRDEMAPLLFIIEKK